MTATKELPPEPVTREIKQLLLACNGLIDIVEGTKSKRWANGCGGGGRFKDTHEWAKFYVAWCELMRDPMDAEFLRQLPLPYLLSLLRDQVSIAQSCDCTFPAPLEKREHPNALLLIGDFAIYPRFTNMEPSPDPKGFHPVAHPQPTAQPHRPPMK